MSHPRIKRRDPTPRIPYVRCREPGHRRQLGYVICLCVEPAPNGLGEKVAHVQHPTADALGEILCAKEKHENDEFVLCCAQCALEEGWISELPRLNP